MTQPPDHSPLGFLDLLRVWEVVPDATIGEFAEKSQTTAEFVELLSGYIVSAYHEEGPTPHRGNLAAWLPWAYAVAHRADIIEEMQDAARFGEQGSAGDETIYAELRKRLGAIRLSAFLPDGVLHGRPDDSQDIPKLLMDEQNDDTREG